MKQLTSTLAVIALLPSVLVGTAYARPAQLPPACQALIGTSFPAWKTATPTEEVTAWAKTENLNPVVATGDFDANGQTDWATIGTDGKKDKVILCLSSAGGKRLATIDDVGCTDLVYSIKARTKVPNYDSGKAEVLRRDSVATSCFEKSGRIFSYVKGKFRVFYHAD